MHNDRHCYLTDVEQLPTELFETFSEGVAKDGSAPNKLDSLPIPEVDDTPAVTDLDSNSNAPEESLESVVEPTTEASPTLAIETIIQEKPKSDLDTSTTDEEVVANLADEVVTTVAPLIDQEPLTSIEEQEQVPGMLTQALFGTGLYYNEELEG